MGGGTCYNGGWLPPGMPVPGGGTTAPPPPTSSPTPTPAPTPAPSGPSTCSMTDPFSTISGLIGVCQNGGWVPYNALAGTVFQNTSGDWLITGSDGKTYVPVVPLSTDFQIGGVRVNFAAVTVGTQNGGTLIQILAMEVR
jgi:hypothetical protein